MVQITEHDAKVTRIIDGDTIWVDLYITILGRRRTFHDTIVRFKDVDTPERGKPGYYDAKGHTYERLMGKTIRMRGDHEEMNGERWVAIPLIDGKFEPSPEMVSRHRAMGILKLIQGKPWVFYLLKKLKRLFTF
jgi:hypothetical protein